MIQSISKRLQQASYIETNNILWQQATDQNANQKYTINSNKRTEIISLHN